MNKPRDRMIARRERRAWRRQQIMEKKAKTPQAWQSLHAVIWLVGLAILAWSGWWWPGILVLVALSAVYEFLGDLIFSRRQAETVQQEQGDQLHTEREGWLPANCPSCGGPINVDTVRWTGERSAACPYCSGNIRPA